TSPRRLVLCVPARRLASCQTTTRWIRSTRGSRPKMSSARSMSPAALDSSVITLCFILRPRPFRFLGFRLGGLLALLHRRRHAALHGPLHRIAHHYPAALGARNGAAQHDEAALDIDLRDFHILRGDALVAVMAVHLLVLEGLARVLTAAGTAE